MTILLLLLALSTPLFASRGQAYPTGTVFTENFGNTTSNPEACWAGGTGDAAKCIQLWKVGAGSPSITTAPAGWTGNALYVPNGAWLHTNGTFPAIPAGSGFTLTMTVSVPSYGTGGGFVGLSAQGNGAGPEVAVSVSSSGFSSPGGGCSKSTGAHTLQLTVAPGASASSLKVDGAACGAGFTEAGAAVADIAIYGPTTNVYVQTITINGSTVTGSWPPSALFDWEGQAGQTASAATLQAGTHCGNGINGTADPANWSLQSAYGPLVYSFVADGQVFPAPLALCGGSFAGSDVSLKMGVPSGDSAGYWQKTFWSVYPDIAFGFYFKFHIGGTGTLYPPGALDFISMSGGSIHNYGLKFGSNLDGSAWYMCGENTDGGAGAACVATPISPDTWYWLTDNISATGDNYISVYNVSGVLIDRVLYNGTKAVNTGGLITFKIGKSGAETMSNPVDVYYSNIVFDYTGAATILPPTLPVHSVLSGGQTIRSGVH